MAWGYGSDPTSIGLVLALLTQAVVFGVLVSPSLKKLLWDWSPLRAALVAAACITGSTALYQTLFPVFGIGVTSGLLSLFVTFPATILNSIVFAVRALLNQKRSWRSALVLAAVPLNLGYWIWLLVFSKPWE